MPFVHIATKEFRSFLNSPLAYIFLMVFVLLLNGSFFLWGSRNAVFWSLPQATLQPWFALMPTALAVLVPALAMKLWPDELKSGTAELLATYPVSNWQVVLGKFLAGFVLILIGLLLTAVTPMVIGSYGNLDSGPVWGAYLGSALMGSAFLAMGLFFGALCREQVTAFILTALVAGALVMLGEQLTNLFLPEYALGLNLHDFADQVSFSTRFKLLGQGLVPPADIFFFVSITVLFLSLNGLVLEARKSN